MNSTARGCSLSSAKDHVRGTALVSQRAAVRAQRGARRMGVYARASLPIHTVQKGESLWSISQKQGCTLEELKRTNYNTLGGDDVIYPGQQLAIPASAKRPVPSYAKPPTQALGYSNKTSTYNNYSSVAPVPAYAPPAPASQKKSGLGLAGAGRPFFPSFDHLYVLDLRRLAK